MFKLIGILTFILITHRIHVRANYCYSLDREKPQRRFFSDATSYAYVRGAEYGRQYAAPFCRPSKFWLLARHGTSLPDKQILESLDELRMLRNEVVANNRKTATSRPSNESLCAEDLKLIHYWNLDGNITVEHSNYLTIQGWNDMKSLAKSFKRIFPDLLGRGYDVKQFMFRYTNEQHTEASYKAFVEGLFGKDAYLNISKVSFPIYPPLWLEKYKPKHQFVEEVNNFKKSSIVVRMISDVSARLGYPYPLTINLVELMWDICRYEQSWYMDSPSAWCAAFTLSDHKILEYIQDLKSQYQTGYTSDFNSDTPCDALEDMIRRFEKSSDPRVAVSFSHSSIIQLFLVALRAFKDDVLMTSLNYNEMWDRKWRTSRLTPYGANILAVKYDCSRDKKDPTPKVKFFLNQRVLTFPWCNADLCKMQDIINQYNAFCKHAYNSADYKYLSFIFLIPSLLTLRY